MRDATASSRALPRHRGAHAHPGDVACARPWPRRGRHPRSRREPHAHLEHGRGARPARGAECRQRSERPGRNSGGAPVTGPGLLRRRPRHLDAGETVKWSYLSVDYAPSNRAIRCRRACAVLRDLHRERYWLSIGEMVRRVIDVCHLRELAFAHARPRDRWRRIEFFLAQARAFEAAGGSSIEEFVAWARRAGRARRVGERRDRARPRRRRGAHPHRPCLEGPRVSRSSCSWDSTPGNRRSDHPCCGATRGPR